MQLHQIYNYINYFIIITVIFNIITCNISCIYTYMYIYNFIYIYKLLYISSTGLNICNFIHCFKKKPKIYLQSKQRLLDYLQVIQKFQRFPRLTQSQFYRGVHLVLRLCPAKLLNPSCPSLFIIIDYGEPCGRLNIAQHHFWENI